VSANILKTIAIASLLGFVLAVTLFEIQGGMGGKKIPPALHHSESKARHLRAPAFNSTQPSLPSSSESFYQIIIDNNLFRPLGWTPPRKREPYSLIGTLIPRDGIYKPQAILQNTNASSTYIVTLGDKLDADTKVMDIQAKQVTLEKDGQLKTLKLNTAPLLK